MSDNLPVNEQPRASAKSGPAGFAWGGIALIGIGVFFLLRQMGLFPSDFNWWAFFILLPAAAIYYRAWQLYRETEQFGRRVRGMVIGASMILLVAIIFLLDLDWGVMWPVFLILAGIGALFNRPRVEVS